MDKNGTSTHRAASWGFPRLVLAHGTRMLPLSTASGINIKADCEVTVAGEWNLCLRSSKHTYLAREDP